MGKASIGERYTTLLKNAQRYSKIDKNWKEKLLNSIDTGKVISVDSGERLNHYLGKESWILSSEQVENIDAGSEIDKTVIDIVKKDGFKWPIRIISFEGWGKESYSGLKTIKRERKNLDQLGMSSENLATLGVFENEQLGLSEKYPFVKGKSEVEAAYAAIQMVCLYQQAPFRGEVAKRLINDHNKRNKKFSLELIGVGCELMGLSCQIASTHWENVGSIELPTVIFIEETPCVIMGIQGGKYW